MATQEWRSFTVRVPEKVYERLSKLAEREISSLNRETNIALRAHLDANGKKGSR
jgi:predicted HicB family RNase H-like nuclease